MTTATSKKEYKTRVRLAKISALSLFSSMNAPTDSTSASENKTKLKKGDSAVGERGEGAAGEELPADLAELKVTIDKLEQVRREIVIPEKEPVPPSVNVKMRKLKPASERHKQTVLVAKMADPDAPVRQVSPSQVQKVGRPQYSLNGQFMPHSILGEEIDFYQEQERRTEGPTSLRPLSRHKSGQMTTSQKEIEKQRALSTANIGQSQDAAAMNHWTDWMNERRVHRDYLKNKLKRPQEELLMDLGDGARKRNEVLNQIDRNLAFIDDGKGYRVGSEFWNQPQCVGSEETGIQFTLGATQKGYPPVYEHTGMPHDIQLEKGYVHIPPGRRGWQDGEFLAKRLRQLQQIIHEVDPNTPAKEDFDELMIRGKNSETLNNQSHVASRHAVSKTGTRVSTGGHVTLIAMESPRTENLPDDFYENQDENVESKSVNIISPTQSPPKSRGTSSSQKYVNGPALRVGGVSAVWEKDDTSRVEEIGASCRVIFDGNQGDQVTSWLEVINYGSTVVRFNWTREKRYNPFDKPTDVLQQRFYFNTGPSVILPRQKLLFPFVFKSDNPGIFSENWQMNTTPKLCGGAKIIVTLKGVAIMVDKYKPVRDELSAMLAKRTAASISKNLLLNIVDALQATRPPPTPLDALLTDEEKFERINPGLAGGVNEKLVDLTNFYRDLFPEEEKEYVVWDLDLNTIREKILEIEDEKQREKIFKKFNDNVYKLTTPIDRPTTNEELYHLVYSSVSRICDGIVSSSMALRNSFALPDVEFLMPPELYDKPLGFAIKQRELFIVEQREEQKRRQKALEGTDKGKDGKKGAPGGKDKGAKGGGGAKERPASKAGSPKKDEASKSNKKMSTVSGVNIAQDSQTDVINEINSGLPDDLRETSAAEEPYNNLNINVINSDDAARQSALMGVDGANTSGVDLTRENSNVGADIFVNEHESEKGGVLDMSRAVTSIELEEPAEDDSLHTKYRERMHIMVRDLIGDNLVELLHAYDDIKMRNPWKPNLPVA
ncbi:MYCBP-associated protein-like isoform X3 [Symsagittifera roscoffensis]|uniref:MYCBP-associated protein-like isoform X3 n=1 Tax=Symsagittifera roscoffensis TaxID=84072 RepID=UPI00307B86A0